MAAKVLILGGGFGGMFTARELTKRLGSSVEVELVNKTNYFVFQPLLPEVGAGSITAMHAVSPLRSLLPKAKLRQARIVSVDCEAQEVTVFQGVQRRPTKLSYDHLVIALGQGVDLTRTPGLTEHALTMKSLDDARRLRAHVLERLEHADITSLPDVKKEALTFCVVGAGFSGVETIGEMRDLIDRSLNYYPNIDPTEVRVVLIEFAGKILGELPESLGHYAMERLEARGIEVLLNTGVASATGTSLETTNGDIIHTRTIVATIGNAPSEIVQDLPLELTHGRIAVERSLRAKGYDNVWSLGDCALIPMVDDPKERRDFAPPTAQFAVREAQCLAENIRNSIDKAPLKPFTYVSKGAMASLGARRGVAEVFGRSIRGYPAWLLWRAYYLSFLPGFRTKIAVLLDWLMGSLIWSVVQIRTYDPPSVRYAHYRAGDRIFEAGNRSDGVYSIISGAAELTLYDEATGEPDIRQLGPGEHFGARVVLGQKQRAGTVKALEDTVVLVFDRDAFIKIATGFQPFRDYFKSHLKDFYGLEWDPAAPPKPDR